MSARLGDQVTSAPYRGTRGFPMPADTSIRLVAAIEPAEAVRLVVTFFVAVTVPEAPMLATPTLPVARTLPTTDWSPTNVLAVASLG